MLNRPATRSTQKTSQKQPVSLWKVFVSWMSVCHMVDFRKALKIAHRNSLVVSRVAYALQDPSITQTIDSTLWSHGWKDSHSPSKEGTRFRILPGDEVSVTGWNQDDAVSRILEGAPGSWQPSKKFWPHVVKVKISSR